MFKFKRFYCEYCGREFWRRAKTARFCSSNCLYDSNRVHPNDDDVEIVDVSRLVYKDRYFSREVKHFTKNKVAALERDDWTCQICGRQERLHVHHRIPRYQGGTEALDNLITLCSGCHMTIEHSRDEETAVNSCMRRAVRQARKDVYGY